MACACWRARALRFEVEQEPCARNLGQCETGRLAVRHLASRLLLPGFPARAVDSAPPLRRPRPTFSPHLVVGMLRLDKALPLEQKWSDIHISPGRSSNPKTKPPAVSCRRSHPILRSIPSKIVRNRPMFRPQRALEPLDRGRSKPVDKSCHDRAESEVRLPFFLPSPLEGEGVGAPRSGAYADGRGVTHRWSI